MDIDNTINQNTGYYIPENDNFSDLPTLNGYQKYAPPVKGVDVSANKIGKRETIELSKDEFAHDIWRFDYSTSVGIKFKGIYKDGILQKIQELGIYKRYRDNGNYLFIREVDNIISEIEISQIKDLLSEYVNNITEPLVVDYKQTSIAVSPEKLREVFLNNSHLIFNKSFLEHLAVHDKPILRDTKNDAYFFFHNAVFNVNRNDIKPFKYHELNDVCIWQSHIKQRSLTLHHDPTESHFVDFLRNVTNKDLDRFNAFKAGTGYLLHNFLQPSRGQAVIAYDEDITDISNPMGGTGKGVFANAIKQVRDVVKIDGKKFDSRDKFKFQDVKESTQVVWLDDVKPEIGFDTFHSCLTDGWTIECKFTDQFQIKPEDSPKLFIASNAIMSGEGTTNKRRQFILEFGNFYSSMINRGDEEPIVEEHGCTFFDDDDWDEEEWNKFFSFMLECCRYYLANGLVSYSNSNVELNRLRQNTSEEFVEWVQSQSFQLHLRYDTKKYFDDFTSFYFGEQSDFNQRTFSAYLKQWASIKGWNYRPVRSNSRQHFTFDGKIS